MRWIGEDFEPHDNGDVADDTPAEWGETGDCDHCDAAGLPVSCEVDPFIDEIYPDMENGHSYWCWDCYCRRCDER